MSLKYKYLLKTSLNVYIFMHYICLKTLISSFNHIDGWFDFLSGVLFSYSFYHSGLLCVWQGVPKPTVHQVLQTLEEKRPKWTNMQLQKARKLCSDRWGVNCRDLARGQGQNSIDLVYINVFIHWGKCHTCYPSLVSVGIDYSCATSAKNEGFILFWLFFIIKTFFL